MSYESIGGLLKRVRIDHGLSAHELSRMVHIRERYIVALEQGDVASVPGTAYARAYIERLLTFLGHDPKEALEAFDAASEEPSRKLFQLSMRWGNSPEPTPAFAAAAAFLALVIAWGWSVVGGVSPARFTDAPPSESAAPATPAAPSKCTDAATTLPCFWEETLAPIVSPFLSR